MFFSVNQQLKALKSMLCTFRHAEHICLPFRVQPGVLAQNVALSRAYLSISFDYVRVHEHYRGWLMIKVVAFTKHLANHFLGAELLNQYNSNRTVIGQHYHAHI